MKKIYGIDLGTTNSLIALNTNKETTIIPDRQGRSLVPSIVSFMDNQTHVVGHRARELMKSNPGKTIYSAKRFMGRSADQVPVDDNPLYFANSKANYIEVQIDGKSYSIPEISSFILADLKKNAERFLNEAVENVVITVPAYFNDHQRQETKKAGQLAGLNVVKIINEPTAAALAYGINKNDSKIAVYDFGGGTFDISILHIRNGAFEVLSTNGNTQLGGDDIDQAIVDYIIETEQPEEITTNDKEQLRQLAIEIKHRLTESEQITVNSKLSNRKFNLTISRSDFEKIAAKIVNKTKHYVKKALKDAELDFTDIDEIVMVGGSTRVPFVQKSVENWFGKKPHTDLNPDEVVAIGAAIQGSILAGTITETVLLDITPLSLGMETMGGVVEKFIMRNSKIPCSVTETFTTAVDNQSSVSIHIVQGEREFATDCTSLGRFILSGITPKPAGHARIDVRFQLDQNGVLQVSAKDQTSKNEQRIIIESSQGLTDEKVEELLRDSIENAKTDIEQRLLVEATTEGNAIIQSCENALKNHGQLISKTESEAIKKSITELKQALNDNLNRKLILDLIDQLDEKSQKFAEIIMNSSIKSVLHNKHIDEIG